MVFSITFFLTLLKKDFEKWAALDFEKESLELLKEQKRILYLAIELSAFIESKFCLESFKVLIYRP